MSCCKIIFKLKNGECLEAVSDYYEGCIWIEGYGLKDYLKIKPKKVLYWQYDKKFEIYSIEQLAKLLLEDLWCDNNEYENVEETDVFKELVLKAKDFSDIDEIEVTVENEVDVEDFEYDGEYNEEFSFLFDARFEEERENEYDEEFSYLFEDAKPTKTYNEVISFKNYGDVNKCEFCGVELRRGEEYCFGDFEYLYDEFRVKTFCTEECFRKYLIEFIKNEFEDDLKIIRRRYDLDNLEVAKLLKVIDGFS